MEVIGTGRVTLYSLIVMIIIKMISVRPVPKCEWGVGRVQTEQGLGSLLPYSDLVQTALTHMPVVCLRPIHTSGERTPGGNLIEVSRSKYLQSKETINALPSGRRKCV